MGPQYFRGVRKLPFWQWDIRDSIVASIPACHAGDQGSIPCHGGFSWHGAVVTHFTCNEKIPSSILGVSFVSEKADRPQKGPHFHSKPMNFFRPSIIASEITVANPKLAPQPRRFVPSIIFVCTDSAPTSATSGAHCVELILPGGPTACRCISRSFD